MGKPANITYPLGSLKIKARHAFNAYIRSRDQDKGCITCGGTVEHACHLYSGNVYWWLEFDETNVNGGCRNCNFYKHSVYFEDHADSVMQRHGLRKAQELYQRSIEERTHQKPDRQYYLDIITKYKL